jgi:RHS repeat-associated protein
LNNGWDVENRMVQSVPDQLQGSISWTYDPWGKRIWKTVPNATGSGTSTQCEFYYYGITGQRLETWSCGYNDSNGGDGSYWSSVQETYSYFGRRLIKINDWVAVDRLGSVRSTGSGPERISYYPWGEERTTTADGRIKFGTYVRDSGPNGQDYADQRYYNNLQGRFWSPDPGGIATADPTDPGSWNRYAYAGDDPINYYDPDGVLAECPAGMHPGPDGRICVGGPSLGGGATGGGAPVSGSRGKPPIKLPSPDPGGGGGGDNPYSKDCLDALNTAKQSTHAVQVAQAARSILQAAVQGTGIGWTMLAAVGVRETGFHNITEVDGAGVGVGVFQITVSPTSGVTAAQASDFTWAASYAAQLLNSNMSYLANQFPNFTSAQLLQATAASYNMNPYKPGNFSGNPDTIDVGTAGGNYGSNIVKLMQNCF